MSYGKSVLSLALMVVTGVSVSLGAINQDDFRAVFSGPNAKAANAEYLTKSPSPELRQKVRGILASSKRLPGDAVQADRAVNDCIMVYRSFYAFLYENRLVDVEELRLIRERNLLTGIDQSTLALMLYVGTGETSHLKEYVLCSPRSVSLFSRVRDDSISMVLREIIAGAVSEQWTNDGNHSASTTVGLYMPQIVNVLLFQHAIGTEDLSRLGYSYSYFRGSAAGMIEYPLSRFVADLRRQDAAYADAFVEGLFEAKDYGDLEVLRNASPEMAEYVGRCEREYRDRARRFLDRFHGSQNASPANDAAAVPK